MKDCDDIVEGLLDEAKAHVALAVSASATSVAEMHIDLASFHIDQMPRLRCCALTLMRRQRL